MEFDHSPVIALNRAIVIANIHGPEEGLTAVATIQGLEKTELPQYLLYAVLGKSQSATQPSLKPPPATTANHWNLRGNQIRARLPRAKVAKPAKTESTLPPEIKRPVLS